MPELESLLKLYLPLIGWVGLGLLLGRTLPSTIPLKLGKFLFWIGVPVGIMIFLRQADLSGSVWIAPVVCWVAVLLGAGLAWVWIKGQIWLRDRTDLRKKPSQGSFLLSTMVGNTGYLGYPIVLTLGGSKYFGWAVFYDTLGSTLAAYGLGVVLAAHFGARTASKQQLLQALVQNPAFWSFWLGLACHEIPFPETVEQGLRGVAWAVIALSLLLLGMRLSQLTSWQNVQQALACLSMKMLLIPLAIGFSLRLLGMSGTPLLVLVLQAGMPPAFATLVIAEAFDLDRELTVTTLAIGSGAILLTLPLWLWLFGA